MLIVKVRSFVFDNASSRNDMPAFKQYFCGFAGFKRTEDGCFISKVQKDGTLDIKLALMDYCFNEPESEKLWRIAENILGKKIIDLNPVKIATL